MGRRLSLSASHRLVPSRSNATLPLNPLRRIVERVRKLIALSASTDDSEARSAALMACRLIREHGLHVDSHAGRTTTAVARSRATSGPYVRARNFRAHSTCTECRESIEPEDAFLDAEQQPVHGDCIPRAERP